MDFHVAAWREVALPSLWSAHSAGHFKGNFDVAVRGSFAMAAKAVKHIHVIMDFHVAASREVALPSLWSAHSAGHFKGNFDVVVRGSFAMAAMVLSDPWGRLSMLLLFSCRARMP
ncbi:hypothetical protein SLA2020_414770 [Shorea laevis]